MTPDKTIKDDLVVGCFALLLIIPVIWVAISHGQFGYAPADECANVIKDGMSYTKKKYLINAKPTYPNIRSWCEKNLDDWRPKVRKAINYKEPPHQNYHY